MNLVRQVMCSNHNLTYPSLRYCTNCPFGVISWFDSNGTRAEDVIARLPQL